MYVTDKERHLTGILSLRPVTADPSKYSGDVMTRDVVNISTNTNQEEVARQYKDMILALPVVDKEKRLVGIVTVDDLIDVIERSHKRYLCGWSCSTWNEDDYFQSSLFTIARRRILWLLILVLANGLTTKLLHE